MIKKQIKRGEAPTLTRAQLTPCIALGIPFLRRGSLYFEMKKDCFIFEEMVFEALYACDYANDGVLCNIEHSDNDRYIMTMDYENDTYYAREDNRVGLFRIIYSEYDFYAKGYDFGIFANGKCGFYNPAKEKFTLPPKFDYICWWQNKRGKEIAFASNGCTSNGQPAKGFEVLIEGSGFPIGGEWYSIKPRPAE
jgi:hypothetical protein